MEGCRDCGIPGFDEGGFCIYINLPDQQASKAENPKRPHSTWPENLLETSHLERTSAFHGIACLGGRRQGTATRLLELAQVSAVGGN